MHHIIAVIFTVALLGCATPLPKNPAVIGMTFIQVLNETNWGHPDTVNRTITAAGQSEQWVYRGAYGKGQYLYFTNGVLTAIQN